MKKDNTTEIQKLIVCIGIPASGKTTWAKKLCTKNSSYIRVNRDDLRNMRFPYWKPEDEKLITEMEVSCAVAGLEAGKNVILDSTNLNPVYRTALVEEIRERTTVPFSIVKEKFEVTLETAIKRDLERTQSVGERVIKGFWDKYIAPNPVKYDEDETLEPCVIVDVDGTLAKMEGRSPYDWSKVGEDSVIEPTKYLTKVLNEYMKVIIFTGRDGICLPETEKWLKDNDIPYDEIYIRPEGSQEKDSVVKRRMFEENIRGKYYCKFWVDDRKQVKEMVTRELGVFVLDVNQFDKVF